MSSSRFMVFAKAFWSKAGFFTCFAQFHKQENLIPTLNLSGSVRTGLIFPSLQWLIPDRTFTLGAHDFLQLLTSKNLINETQRHLHSINDLKHPRWFNLSLIVILALPPRSRPAEWSKKKAFGVTNAERCSQISSEENEVMNLNSLPQMFSLSLWVRFKPFLYTKASLAFVISAFMCFSSVWRWKKIKRLMN